MNHEDERNHEDELAVAREYEREQWEELGRECAQSGISRRAAHLWLKVSATVSQERAFWCGYETGEKSR
jgi:hypothetical protein